MPELFNEYQKLSDAMEIKASPNIVEMVQYDRKNGNKWITRMDLITACDLIVHLQNAVKAAKILGGSSDPKQQA